MELPGRKILLVRTDRLGDVVLSLPLSDALRQKLPDIRIGFLCREYTAPAVKMSPSVNEVLVSEDKQLMKKIGEYDAAVLIHPTIRDALLLFSARIPIRIGTAYRAYSFLLTHRIAEHRKYCEHHELTYNLHLLRPLGIDIDWLPPKLIPPVDALKKAEDLLIKRGFEPQRFITIHPGSSGSSLKWSAMRFAELASALGRRKVKFIVTAGKGEYELAKYVAGGDERKIFSSLSLPVLAALYSMSAAIVAPNTGTLHLADAVGAKAFAVFPLLRTMSAKRWAPTNFPLGAISPDGEICKKCSKKCKNFPCTELITVQSVISRIEKFINFDK